MKIYKLEIGDGQGRRMDEVHFEQVFEAVDLLAAVNAAKRIMKSRPASPHENTAHVVNLEASAKWTPSVAFLRGNVSAQGDTYT